MGDRVRVHVEGNTDRVVIGRVAASFDRVDVVDGGKRAGKDAMVERVKNDVAAGLRAVCVRDLDGDDAQGVLRWTLVGLGLADTTRAVQLSERAFGLELPGSHVAVVAVGLRDCAELASYGLTNAMLDDYIARALHDPAVWARWHVAEQPGHAALLGFLEDGTGALRERGFRMDTAKRVHQLARVAADRDLRPATFIEQLGGNMNDASWEPLRSDLEAAIAWLRRPTPGAAVSL